MCCLRTPVEVFFKLTARIGEVLSSEPREITKVLNLAEGFFVPLSFPGGAREGMQVRFQWTIVLAKDSVTRAAIPCVQAGTIVIK